MVNVLVVDDDKEFLRIVQKVLEAGGFSVVTTTDAMGALELLQKEIFDLVLSDANMPGGSGFDLVRTVRRNPDTAMIPIAMLTGRREKEDIAKGMQAGADDYIVKPIDPDLFVDKIGSLLKNRQGEVRPEINFAETATRVPCRWDVSTEIVAISEKGLTLKSQICASTNSKFKVQSQIFEWLAITPPMMRVIGCIPDPTDSATFLTTVSFVGLTDTERQKIRYWVNSQGMLKQQKKVS